MTLSRELIPRSFFRSPLVRFPSFFEEMEDEMSQLGNWQHQTDIQIESDENNLYVKVPTPGFDPAEIDISIKNGTLYITCEHKEENKENNKNRKIHHQASRQYKYTLTLPERVDEGRVNASSENGLLLIELPKEKKSEVKKISIKKK